MSTPSSRIIQKILNSELRDQSSIMDNNNNSYDGIQQQHHQQQHQINQFNDNHQHHQQQQHNINIQHINNVPSVQMVIELDSARSAILNITAYDNPQILAKKFCFDYGIDTRIISTLTANIRNVQNMQFGRGKRAEQINSNNNNKNLLKSRTKGNCSMEQDNNQISSSAYSPIHNKNNNYSSYQENKQNQSSFMNTTSAILIDNSMNSSSNMITKQNNIWGGTSSSGIARIDTSSLSNNNSYGGRGGRDLMKQSRQTVFDRLYKDSRKKKKLPEYSVLNTSNKKSRCQLNDSTAIMNQSSMSRLGNNSCLEIYDKNTKARQASLKKRDKLFQEKFEKQVKKCTFKPQINQISQIIAKKLPQTYYNEKSRFKDINKIKQYIYEKQRKQLEQCTFEPKILERSRCRSRSKSTERYQCLYEEASLKNAKRKHSESVLQNSRKNCVPQINKLSNSINNGRTFFDRLRNDSIKRNENKIKIEDQLLKQRLRGPSTGRAPTNRDRVSSIGDHLYQQAQLKLSRQKQRASESVEKKKFTCSKSEKLYLKSKTIAFQYIFVLMDSDEDGLISHTKINLSYLPQEVLKLLTPLLIEMQEIKAELDQSEFTQALDRLFKVFIFLSNLLFRHFPLLIDKQSQACADILIDINQNLLLFRYYLPLSQTQPALNQNSMNWAQQYRPFRVDQYELWKETQPQKQQKFQEIRTMKILEQLQQCTFHPRLFR